MLSAENRLDPHLLRVLCALLSERSVTRAAAKLGLSQPATSIALRKLREIFGDELLVRGRDGMVATGRAVALHHNALKALEQIDNLLLDPERFDAAESRQTFTIALPDYIAPTYMAGVVREFRAKAPLARLIVRSLGSDFDFESALASGNVDIVIGNWPAPPSYLRTALLFEDEVVSLVGSDHAFVRRPPSREEYLSAHHVAPIQYSGAHRSFIETHLSKLRTSRDIRVNVSYFTLAPYLLIETDLVFTTARHFARYYAGLLPLAIIKPPVDFPRMRFYQLWHASMHHSPTHVWFRKMLTGAKLSLAARGAG